MSGTMLPIPAGYVNHIDSIDDGHGTIYVLITLAPPDKTVDSYLLRRKPTGAYDTIHVFLDHDVGKSGYGAVAICGQNLVCVLSTRQPDGSQRAVEYIVPIPS
jgi:hypothetical protein